MSSEAPHTAIWGGAVFCVVDATWSCLGQSTNNSFCTEPGCMMAPQAAKPHAHCLVLRYMPTCYTFHNSTAVQATYCEYSLHTPAAAAAYTAAAS